MALCKAQGHRFQMCCLLAAPTKVEILVDVGAGNGRIRGTEA